MKKKIIVVALVIVGVWGIRTWRNHQKPPTPPSPSITIKGSDTEVQLVSTLVESFVQQNPTANISVTGGGSGAGIAALLNRQADVANSSRALTADERSQAVGKGLSMQEFILARDGLSIIVHPTNTIKQLTMDDLGKIYRGDIRSWKEVGGNDAPIVLYGRQSTSGTFTFFRDVVLKADYAATMRSMEGNQAIVDAIKNDANGIGYVGVGYVKDDHDQPRSGISILSIATTPKATPISSLNAQAVKQGLYPIARPIYQYIGSLANTQSPIHEFLRFEMSEEGQRIVERNGFYSMNESDVTANKKVFQAMEQ